MGIWIVVRYFSLLFGLKIQGTTSSRVAIERASKSQQSIANLTEMISNHLYTFSPKVERNELFVVHSNYYTFAMR